VRFVLLLLFASALMLGLSLEDDGMERVLALLPKAPAVNPGGSGMPVAFGFVMGGLFKSITHCGGGGGGPAS
jgi:hypothetical protein